MNKEHNFVSAVIYVSKDVDQTLSFLETVYTVFDEHFLQFEFIVVNGDRVTNNTKRLEKWAESTSKPITMLNMSVRQLHEQCMNAGLDIAIGDYVYEFDSIYMPYNKELIWDAYNVAIKGNDIVTVCPSKEHMLSHCFYKTFNKYSNSPYKLKSDAFRLVSRRAINRTHAISDNLPYRKAAYAACGLKQEELQFDGYINKKEKGRVELATNSIVLYTDFGYKFSVNLALFFGFVTLAMFVYALYAKVTGSPTEGWTSLACILTFGFSGLFGILAIAMKYLTLLVRLIFKKQQYLVESIEKM